MGPEEAILSCVRPLFRSSLARRNISATHALRTVLVARMLVLRARVAEDPRRDTEE